jgi:hypothetical protein
MENAELDLWNVFGFVWKRFYKFFGKKTEIKVNQLSVADLNEFINIKCKQITNGF